MLKEGLMDDFIPADGGIEWELYENHTLSVLDLDISSYPLRKAMMLLSRNKEPVDFKIVNVGERYSYYNESKLILQADIEAVFSGKNVYLAKLFHIYQYSESAPDLLLNNTVHLFVAGSPKVMKWQLFQNYSLTAVDIDSKALPRQVWLRLDKNDIPFEDKILETGANFTFYQNGSEILDLSIGDIFDGRNSDLAFISKVYQYSEIDGSILMQNGSHLFISGSYAGIDWQLYDNYTLAFMDADYKITPVQVWLRMKKDGITVDDTVSVENQMYSYTNPSAGLIFNGKIAEIFR